MKAFLRRACLTVCATAIGFCFGVGTVVEAGEAARKPISAPAAAFSGQYHIVGGAVPPVVLGSVSAVDIPLDSSVYLARQRTVEGGSYSAARTSRQYHEDRRVQLALGLGAIYVVFLVCWVWATRVRPRRR